MSRAKPPTGTVTFLFTDVEGSTKLLHELGATLYGEALGDHRRLLRRAFAGNGGFEVGTVREAAGDAVLAADGARQIQDYPLAVASLELFAVSAAASGDARQAAMILGATEAAREAMDSPPDEDELAIRARALELLDGDNVDAAWAEGRALDLASALELPAAGAIPVAGSGR